MMLARAVDAGVRAACATGDEVYGADSQLRAELEGRRIRYVLAVACDQPVVAGGALHRADALLGRVPARAWQCVSAGTGAKGRYYGVGVHPPGSLRPCTRRPALAHDPPQPHHRRAGLLPLLDAPPLPLAMWSPWRAGAGASKSASRPARASSAWRPTRSAAGAPGTAGPTLAMLAHAVLVVAALTSNTHHPPPLELILLTCNELQHLVAALLARPAADPAHRLRWLVWRRRQQARARACHYHRQANGP